MDSIPIGIDNHASRCMANDKHLFVTGLVAKVPFFQMVQISLLSVLIYFTRCEYDILKVLFI
jgi:hypothetical protein